MLEQIINLNFLEMAEMSHNIFKLVNEGNLSEIQGLVTGNANVVKQKDEVRVTI